MDNQKANIGILLLLFLSFCTISQAQQKSLSKEEKLYGLSLLWKEVSYNFAYPQRLKECKWDSLYQAYMPKVIASTSNNDYTKLLQSFLCTLNNCHTDIMTSFDTDNEDYYLLKVKQIDNHFYITNICVDLKKEVPRGSEIVSVENQPIAVYLQKYYSLMSGTTPQVRYWKSMNCLENGPKNSSVKLSIKTPENQYKSFVLNRDAATKGYYRFAYPIENRLCVYKNIGQIAYLRISSFENEYVNRINDSINVHQKEMMKAKALIIDVRGNGGGTDGAWSSLAEKLWKGTDTLAIFKLRYPKHASYLKAKGQYADSTLMDKIGLKATERDEVRYYNGAAYEEKVFNNWSNYPLNDRITCPLIVLCDNETASAAEGFVLTMKGAKRGVIVGEKTMGALGQPLIVALPGNILARICTTKTLSLDNQDYSESGITPDVIVIPKVSSITNGVDDCLDTAIKMLK